MFAVQRSEFTGRYMVFYRNEYLDSFATHMEALDFINSEMKRMMEVLG